MSIVAPEPVRTDAGEIPWELAAAVPTESKRQRPRVMMRLMALLAIIALVLAGIVAAATLAIRPCYADEADDAAQWFTQSGPSYVRSHAAHDLPSVPAQSVQALAIGTPVRAYEYASGGLKASSQWVAPVSLDGSVRGVLELEWSSAGAGATALDESAVFGQKVTSLAAGERLLVDESLATAGVPGPFFLLSSDAVVSPGDTASRGYLAGSVSLEAFLSILTDLQGASAPPTDASGAVEAAGGTHPVWWVIAILMAIVLAAGFIVWYRHEPPERAHTEGESDAEDSHHRFVFRHEDGTRTVRRGASQVRIIEKPTAKEDA